MCSKIIVFTALQIRATQVCDVKRCDIPGAGQCYQRWTIITVIAYQERSAFDRITVLQVVTQVEDISCFLTDIKLCHIIFVLLCHSYNISRASAAALSIVLRKTMLSYGNMRFSGTSLTKTPKPINMKFCTIDHKVSEVT
jgi:hypothetical protein